MVGEDVKGKIWEVQAMCENDSTYRGMAERQDFYFKSPLAKLEEMKMSIRDVGYTCLITSRIN